MDPRRFLVLIACAFAALGVPGEGSARQVHAAPLAVVATGTDVFHSTGSRDGWVLESSETSSKGGSYNAGSAAVRIGDDALRRQYRTILSFDTSSLDNAAEVTAASLTLVRQKVVGGGDPFVKFQGMLLDIRHGTFGSAPLRAGDFQAAASLAKLGPLTPLINTDEFTFDLPSEALTKINTGGLTQLRLRFKVGDNNNSQSNYVSFFSGNNSSALQPQLSVSWSVPDTTPPDAIVLSAVQGIVTDSVDLSWTAPGDDGLTGTASSYEVRYATSAITTEDAWNAASDASSGAPTPGAAGAFQFMTVSGLGYGQEYFFSVRAVDAASNMGALSNSPSVTIPNT